MQLDSNFATANAVLGVVQSNMGSSKLASEYLKKAYDLRERASERERFYIEGHYHDIVTGDQEKAAELYFARQIAGILLDSAVSNSFQVHAYCLMPDHVHLLVEGAITLSNLLEFVRVFKMKTSFQFNKLKRNTTITITSSEKRPT